jgi:DNA ligase-associated metallophosphoesterase
LKTLAWRIAGEDVLLDSERAVYWPREKTLIVADVHLGKGSVFRRSGIAVPTGSTQHDLQRLASLIARHRARRLLVLGDLFHARLDDVEPWHAQFDAFRRQHTGLRIEVVQGNHDERSGAPPQWHLNWLDAPHVEPPFALMHDATPSALGHALGGHVHPVFKLQTRRERLRLPVFWLREALTVLPSFGVFTGGWEVRPHDGDRLVAAAAEGLVVLR